MPTLEVDDGTLWYDTYGNPAGQPLVCLHGGWQNGETWEGQIEHFADEYRIITFDVRGHGETGATDRRRYSVELFADDLETLLSTLEIEQPILCGLSLGSMVVQAFLDRYPDRAAGAIIAGPLRSMPPVDLPPGTKAFATPVPALATSLMVVGSATTFRTLLESVRFLTGGRWLALEPSVRSSAMAAAEDVSKREFRKVFSALYTFDPPTLSAVQTPTLVVYGDHEAPQVKRQGQQIAETVVNGRLEEIEAAGHLVNQDQPAAFNTVIADFLEGLGQKPA